MNRNDPCPCGSGRRYKHCHGRIDSAGPGAPHAEALTAHRSGSLERAEALYRRAIDERPDHVESRHMLGVLQFERMRFGEALDLLWEAAERTGWAEPAIRKNLGLALATFLGPQANARQEVLVAGYTARARALKGAAPVAARVSVVLPVYNDARLVARAIASVAAQTYGDIELVVVDDGSTDDTATVVAQCLSGLAFPAKLVRREHRGAGPAANAGAEQAAGRYLAFLGARDRYAPDRIERMVAEIARATPLWGFSRVAYAVDDGGGSGGREPHRDAAARPRDFLGHEPASFTLLTQDVAGSSGNLFIDRKLFLDLGGYGDRAQFRGWDLCVRAAEAVEPVAVDQRLYFLGERERSPAPGQTGPASADRMAAALIASALTREAPVANEFCPQFAGNRDLLLRAELRAGRGDRIPVPTLRSLAATWRDRANAAQPRKRDASAPGTADRTALVVLGVYRSGTSALSRALNLCGAFLPERVLAPRLGINPKGFWETEAVNHLDARLLLHLGADWKRVDFVLPQEGPIVDEFLADAGRLLATEYGDAPFILIKDPRICVLAPLWHRALKQNGYRPVYVVPVRNPLEVARSLEAQGDMPTADGLALWLTYMQRVEAFVDSIGAGVVHLRYTELLDDWRRVVDRIARRLHVPLALDRRADEVDRFLEAGLRNHQAADGELEAHFAAAPGDALRAMYRQLLDRCERDAAGAS